MEFIFTQYLFLIFPIICILFSFRKRTSIFPFLFFILFFTLSNVGEDNNTYNIMYQNIKDNESLHIIHGEIIYKLYMMLYVRLGIEFKFFKFFHFLILTSLVSFSLYKINNTRNNVWGLYILYCSYILYFFAIFRQVTSISMMLFGCYLIKKNKENAAILLNLIAMGFHISSILPVIFFVLYKYNKIPLLKKKTYVNFILLSFIIRVISKFSYGHIANILSLLKRKEHFMYYIKTEGIKLFTFGIISRLVIVILLLIVFKKSKIRFYNSLYSFYMLTMVLYFCFPFNLIMGRLTNNIRVVDVIIFPYILSVNTINLKKYFLKFFIVIFFGLILINFLCENIKILGDSFYYRLIF